MHRRELLAIVAIALLGLACGGSTTDAGPQPANVIVAPNTVTIPQKGTATLTVSVTDKDARLLTGVAVTFQPSDATILAVSNLGVITSVGPAGTTSVIVRAGPASGTVPVIVTQVLSGIAASPDPLTVVQKGTAQLQAQVVDAAGSSVPGAVITYKPSNTTLLGVSTSGLVLSLGPAGASSITLSSGTLSHTVNATVTAVAADLQLSATSLLLVQGGTAQLSGTVVDLVGSPIANSTVTWASSNPGLVTVSGAGLLTSVGGLGSATITAQSGTFTRTATVNVVVSGRPAGNVIATVNFPSAWGIAISPAGVVFAPKSDGSAVARTTLPATAFSSSISNVGGLAAAFNSTGSTAYIADESRGSVDIIDVPSNTVTGSITGLNGPLAVILSHDDRMLYVSTSGGTVVPVDLTTNSLVTAIPASAVNAFCSHPSQPLIYASAMGSGQIVEINTSTNTTKRTFSQSVGTVQQCAVSQDGSTLYVLVEDLDVLVFDLASGAQRSSIVGAGGFGAAITADGTQLWVTSRGVVKIVDLALGTVRSITVPSDARRIAFSKDGLTAVIATDAGKIIFIQ